VSDETGAATGASWVGELDGRTALDRVLAHRPAVAERFGDLDRAVRTETPVDPVTVELCRLRIATVLGCGAEQRERDPAAVAAGLTEDLVADLPHYSTSDRFDERTRIAVEVAEQYVIDPHGLTDDQFVRLRDAWGADGVAGVVLAVATFDARCRLRLGLGIGDRP
jgi:alkylhydroperoxidase family enzyme